MVFVVPPSTVMEDAPIVMVRVTFESMAFTNFTDTIASCPSVMADGKPVITKSCKTIASVTTVVESPEPVSFGMRDANSLGI